MIGATPDGGPTYEELVERVASAEQTLSAMQQGEVDALLVTVEGGLRVYTLEGADTFYRTLVEQMPEGAAVVDGDGRVVYANSSFAEMLHTPLEVLIGAALPASVDPGDRSRLDELLHDDHPTDAEVVTLVTREGTAVPVALSISPVDGYVEGARCVVAVDLTHRQEAEAALREAESRFRGAFDNAPVGMALLDLDGRVEQANPALCAIAGLSLDAMLGRPLPWQADPGDVITDELVRLVSGQVEESVVERRWERSDGRTIWVAIQLRLLRDGARRAQRVIVQVQNESARRLHEEELRHVADHDGLTGLLNRRAFEDALAHHLDLTVRYGAEGALLVLDVDHFKYINDTRGHHVGDRVLVALADALRTRLRVSDVIGRLGGDEYAILLPHGDAEVARLVADEVLAAARGVDVAVVAGSRQVTVSVGIAPVSAGRTTPGELMALADMAMYDSKEAGRNRASTYDGSADEISSTGTRLTWLNRIEEALLSGTLLLDAQPIIDLSTGAPVQQELLVRLPSPHGRISAGAWFPVAERYGLAPAIDEWVVDRAFDILAIDPAVALNVNVSAMTVGRAGWREQVREGLARTGVDAHRITFEITETVAIANMAAAIRFADDLRSLGCRLALDDFGAGFGSFYYLKHLPLDDVKIDGEFVRDCVNDRRDRTIIKAMVDVVGAMGRRAVAECIEDAATLELVNAQDIYLAQGYHLGRPVPISLP